MVKIVIRIFFVLSAFLLQGCATLYLGNHDTVHFASVPQGARVEINGEDMGQTPISLDMRNTISKREVTITKEGYKTKKFKLAKRLPALAVLDILTIIGGVIDVCSGAITPYKEEYYEVELKSTKDPNVKVNKKEYYNLNDNYYVLTFRHDTFYCEPDVKEDFGRVYFTPLDAKRRSLSNDDIYSYKATLSSGGGLFNLDRHNHEDIIYEAHPYWPEKRPDKLIYMKLCMNDTAYKLLSFLSPSGVSDDGVMNAFGSGGMAYYIFKGNMFVAPLGKFDFFEKMRKYFPMCDDFIKYLEDENASYKDLEKYFYLYKKEHKQVFYVSPL